MVSDAIRIAALVPKSGHVANSHAKVAAAAIVTQLSGLEALSAKGWARNIWADSLG